MSYRPPARGWTGPRIALFWTLLLTLGAVLALQLRRLPMPDWTYAYGSVTLGLMVTVFALWRLVGRSAFVPVFTSLLLPGLGFTRILSSPRLSDGGLDATLAIMLVGIPLLILAAGGIPRPPGGWNAGDAPSLYDD